jgi:hypothetical protein
MIGELRLKGRWLPFSATQWLAPRRGFEWRASVGGFLRFRGFDRYESGAGAMCWRLFGLLPLVRASGADVTRSARDRAAAEAFWAPAALAADEHVVWEPCPDGWIRASWEIDGASVHVELDVDDQGRPRAVRQSRWGNPDAEGWRELPFGGHLDAERTFDGLTVPTRVRGGWWFGEDRYESEGEFFRAEVLDLRVESEKGS